MAEVIGCETCPTSAAVVFCLCQRAPSFLCQGCIPAHCAQYSSGVHDFCSMQDLDYVKQVTIDVYKQKKLSVAQSLMVADSLERNELQDYEDLKRSLEELFRQVSYFVDELHRTLQVTIKELKTGLQEAVHQETHPKLIDYMLENIQSLQKTTVPLFNIPVLTTIASVHQALAATTDSFQHFDFTEYVLHHIKEAVNKETDALAPTPEEQKQPYLPVLMGNTLRKYFLGENARLGLVELTYSPDVDQETSYAFMDYGSLFVCGGKEGRKHAYLIGAKNSQVTILPSMIQGRACPGVIGFNNIPYVFGGSTGTMLTTTCERYLDMERWEIIGSQMCRPRSAFTPCIYNSLIYLPGGLSTNNIEVFDPLQLTFRNLPALLPGSAKNVSFVTEDSLCIIYKSELLTVNLKDESQEINRQKLANASEMWSPIPPVTTDRQVLFWCFEDTSVMSMLRSFMGQKHGLCYSFEVKKKELRQEERFEYVIS